MGCGECVVELVSHDPMVRERMVMPMRRMLADSRIYK